jgi:putative acetyltransferase
VHSIRTEIAEDQAEILAIHVSAFGRADEAQLVDRLRADGDVLLSLVAEVDSKLVGHVLFSRMWIDANAAVALAPVAVLREYQRQGIAADLIRDGLDDLRRHGEEIVIVLGEPRYYSRFGFSVQAAALLKSPFPPEAFMAMELIPGALHNVSGKVRYPRAFEL